MKAAIVGEVTSVKGNYRISMVGGTPQLQISVTSPTGDDLTFLLAVSPASLQRLGHDLCSFAEGNNANPLTNSL